MDTGCLLKLGIVWTSAFFLLEIALGETVVPYRHSERLELRAFAAAQFKASDNHCDTFSKVVQYAVSKTNNVDDLLEDLYLVLIGDNLRRQEGQRGQYYFGIKTNSSGFKDELKDKSPQVEHAMVGIYLSKRLQPGGVGAWGTMVELGTALLRLENPVPDSLLYMYAEDLGDRLTNANMGDFPIALSRTLCKPYQNPKPGSNRSEARAWQINADFETGALGAQAQGSDAFSVAFDSIYTNEVVQSGNKAVQLKINRGGIFVFPSALHEGDEIWFKVSLYFPADFNFHADGDGIKTLRINTENTSGGDEGYIDALIGSSGINIRNRVDPNFYKHTPSRGSHNNLGLPVPTKSWITLQQYVKFSSTEGRGVYRVWRDGSLIFEDLISKTLKSSESISNYIKLFSYWTENAPATPNAYADNIVITRNRPSNVDSHGNHCIGGGSSTSASPYPPTIN